MKDIDKILKEYGLNISLISEETIIPKLVIYHDDGYSRSYNLTNEQLNNFKKNYTNVIDNIIDIHMKTHLKYIRKKKLLKLNEI
jgi:hypothetical protein